MNKWLSLLSLLVLTTSCRDITEVAGGEDGLSGLVIPGIKEQTQSERTWANVNLTKIMTLPDTSVTVYQLGGVYADERDNIYLVDLGIMKIYQFDSLGNYIKAFGHGVGEGPGEFLQIMDVGVVGDTMMYLLDAYRSAVSFFKLNGEYSGGRSLPNTPWQYVLTEAGREYVMHANGELLFSTILADGRTEFGRVVEDQGVHRFAHTAGRLGIFSERMIYVPSAWPVIVAYRVDGSIAYARGTLDYGREKPPHLENQGRGDMQSSILVGTNIHVDPISVYDDRIHVHANRARAIDVYQAATGDYVESIELPVNTFTYIMNDRVYQVQDTLAVVWEMRK